MVLSIILGVLGSGVLSTLISCLFSWKKDKRQQELEKETKKDVVKSGVRILLYDRIKYLGRHHIEHGEISAEDLEDIITMHRSYHDDLGGNGYLDSIMDAVKRLPIKR